MRLLLALATVLMLADGCASPAASPAPSPTAPALQLDEGANKIDIPVLPSEVPAAGERTLDKVPQWRLGEWWSYHIVDGFSGNELDTTRIVAGTYDLDYLVGFPLGKFSNDVLIFHIPGVGDVNREDLSFEVHDVTFQPLSFPLTAGKRWDTAFEGRPGHAMVSSVDGATAKILLWDTRVTTTGVAESFNMTATYDASVGEIVALDYPGYLSYKVTGHGFHYDGRVRVPHSHDLIFQHGRVAGTLNAGGLAPQTTVKETVDIPIGYDNLAFTEIVGSGVLVPGAAPNAGYYDEKATSPNGTVFETTALPGEAGLKLAFFGTGDPTGTWTLEHTAGGPGAAFIEGIGYHSIDVDLPSGCVVAGKNAGHHGNPCKA